VTTADYSTCPGPTGDPIPLVHFDDARGDGKLAVSFCNTLGMAVFTTPATPFDFTVHAVGISAADRRELARLLLDGLPEDADA
jgi:hypothetical protein